MTYILTASLFRDPRLHFKGKNKLGWTSCLTHSYRQFRLKRLPRLQRRSKLNPLRYLYWGRQEEFPRQVTAEQRAAEFLRSSEKLLKSTNVEEHICDHQGYRKEPMNPLTHTLCLSSRIRGAGPCVHPELRTVFAYCRSGTPALPCFTGDAERPCLVKISSTLNNFLGLNKQFEKHCPKAVTAVQQHACISEKKHTRIPQRP